MRNIMVTLMVSVTPMISHDEAGVQLGNNNGYCQDNEITWINWAEAGQYADMLEFTRQTALRRRHPVFGGAGSSTMTVKTDNHMRDICWITRNGVEMTSDDWHSGISRWRWASTAGTGTGRPRRTDHRRLVPAVLQRPRLPGGLRHSHNALRHRLAAVIDTSHPAATPSSG